MRRPIALLALWFTAVIVCTTLGWLTVGMVSGQSRESSLPQLISTATTPHDAAAALARPLPAIRLGSTRTSTSTASPPVSTPPPAPTTSATIAGRGGSVVVSYDGSTGTVSLLRARPHDGFTMNLQATGPHKVEVRFESDAAESRVFAWWDGDPRERVEERN